MKQSIFLTLASLFFVFLNAGAAVIYVDTDATGSNNGSSWNNAYTDLQSALAVAGSNDEIWVAAGVYKPTSGVDRDIAFEIPSGVELYGGFVGTETTRSQRNWGVNASILSGAIGSGDATDNSRRIVLVENALQTVIVDGFHIRKAYNEDPGSEESPIYVRESLVEIRHCQIYDNTAEDACAVQVLYSVQSTVPDVLLDNCLIYDNTSTGASGSIVDCAAYEGHVEIRGCTFTQNDLPGIYSGIFSGQQTGGVNPGALYTMFNSIVWDNDYTDDFFSAESMVAYYNILQEELPLIGVSGGLNLTIDNLVLDPMFIAPGANDFALHLASPAINSGDNTYNTLTYDVAKNNRVFESTVDRGCYENQLGGVIYVDVDAGGADNGTSWANAFNDLQDALAIAAAGSDIWVAEGYYYPTGGSNRDISFIIPDGVALYGGFDGTETQRSQRNWDFNVTRLSGNIGNLASQTDNTKQLVVIQNAAANGVIVDGFTIQDAYNGSAGGALYINNSVAEIVHCDIKDNRANLGPALQCLLSDVTVDNCLIRSNTVVDDGGIINGFTQPNEIHVLACTITNNDMTSASGRAVGGTSGTPIEIFNSIIWDNDNNGLGSGPSFTVANCIIEGGYAGTNVLNADPLFIAPPADYTPALNSPARNAGDNTLGVLSKDFYHNNRQFDDIVDIGCVESQDDGIIYVDADATGSNSGDSWVNAYTSLTTALNNAGEGNEIWVATGTYKPTTTTDRNLKFTIPAGVELYGGFGGFETERNQRDWGLFP
ncbi:MAG: hypothetical protein JNM00_16595, partial [Flavobacteriales bacterium]|nr:hypothetical protein [Flavobacteriales bacterium]